MEFKTRNVKTCTIFSLKEYIDVIANLKEEFKIIFNNDYGFDTIDKTIEFDQKEIKSEEDFFERNRIYNDYNTYSKYIPTIGFDTNVNDEEFNQKIMFFYRGLYDESYDLKPSCVRGNNYRREKYYYDNIKVLCSNYFPYKSHLNDLVTMQHYDAPTRLLDVTTNPLVALFFACKDFTDKNNSDKGKVYVFAEAYKNILFSDSDKAVILACLAKFSLDEQQQIYNACIKKIKSDGYFAKFDASNNGKIIEKLYHEIRSEKNFDKLIYAKDILNSFFVQPQKTNPRIQNQSGAFLLCGLAKYPNDYDTRIREKILVEITVENRDTILKELDTLNIQEAFLFPEIDKVAKYLKTQ